MSGATVYDVETGESSKIVMNAGELRSFKLNSDGTGLYQLSSMTDQNWTAGYHNTANILLFEYDEELLADLLKSKNVLCEGNSFPIESIDYDSRWISVSVGVDASICKYPNYIQLE